MKLPDIDTQVVVSVRYVLVLRVHVRYVQNNQQLKELQAAYKNRSWFDISLNGTRMLSCNGVERVTEV